MKILIVDDLQKKIVALVDVFTKECHVDREDILVAQCANDARKILTSTEVDLLIIDLILPLRPEDSPSLNTSMEFLTELIDEDVYRCPTYILGLTAYSDAVKEAEPRFQDQLWSLVYFDESTSDWAKPICNAVEFIKKRLNQVPRPEFQTDVCIVTALRDPEMKAVFRLPWSWEAATPLDDTTFIRRGRIGIGNASFSVIAASAPRMGMVASALIAAKLIENYRPRFLAMTGICAGLKGRTQLGDIIFADASWDWQNGKRIIEDKKSRLAISPHQLVAPEFLRARVREIADDTSVWSNVRRDWPNATPTELRLLMGPIASGSVVLADPQIVSEILSQHRSLLGIEMEVYGVFAAAAASADPRPTPIVFKSVCDFGDEEKNDEMQSYASYTSASALKLFLERYLAALKPLAG